MYKMRHIYCQMTIYWMRIDHGTAVEVQNGRGRYSRRHNDVNSRPLSRCPRSPAGRCGRPLLRIPGSACAWSKCGSRISEQRWRSFSVRPKPSRDPTKNRKRSEERKVRIAITVRAFFTLSHASERIPWRIQIYFQHDRFQKFLTLKFLVDPGKNAKFYQ